MGKALFYLAASGTGTPFNPASPQARDIEHLFIGVLFLAAFIFLVVTSLVVYALYHYRAGKVPPGEPKQVHGHRALEIIWTAIPLGILAVLFGFTVATMHAVEPPVGNHKPDLYIIAHQWWWEYRYPAGIVTANELHMPVGQTWLVQVDSADVIHDFWVPQLARKTDAIPGHTNYIWITPRHTGTYLGTCAEFCGAEHAWMRIRILVQTPEEFAAWYRGQEKPAATVTDREARQGQALLMEKACVNCHTIRGSSARGSVGPDLTHLASRETLATGVMKNTLPNLTGWLLDPDNYKPGVNMPNLHLKHDEALAMATYLEALR